MAMRTTLISTIVGLGFCLFLVSCSKPPTQDIKAAKTAIEDARAAEADKYAADDFQAAKDALADAEAKVESKDYKSAKEAALLAKEKAELSKSSVEANKTKVRTETEVLFNEAKTAVDSAKQSIDEAMAAKVGKEDLAQPNADVVSLDSLTTKIQNAINVGDFVDARGKSEIVKAKAVEINKTVRAAIAKRLAKK